MAVREHAFVSAQEAVRALATAVAAQLDTALKARPRASLVVSGGRSPIGFFHALREMPLDWARVRVSLADERWLPPQHPDSNAHLVAEHLLQGAAAAAQFVPLWDGAPSPAPAIAERQQALGVLPRPFDAVVLGMGEDGHTASLFPGADTLEEALCPPEERPCQWVSPPAAEHDRLTLTLPRLLATEHLILFFRGAEKRALYQRVLAEPDQPAVRLRYPVANVLFQQGTPVAVFWSP
ncbi:MAG TPA: 6-phosphogluconolactonase [Gammaproteobacteria bacterium]|nr:6-phosphogluconolactonase [Gammaproteobacteria bacterium]MCH78258.1 6-phosphogluconolactonase [Gammaproteobacteria bacterium]